MAERDELADGASGRGFGRIEFDIKPLFKGEDDVPALHARYAQRVQRRVLVKRRVSRQVLAELLPYQRHDVLAGDVRHRGSLADGCHVTRSRMATPHMFGAVTSS